MDSYEKISFWDGIKDIISKGLEKEAAAKLCRALIIVMGLVVIGSIYLFFKS